MTEPAPHPLAARRILLTGGAGFVGRYLTPALRAAAPDAACTMLTHQAGEAMDGWTPAVADLTDAAAVEAAVDAVRPDLVVHLAAQSSVGASVGAADRTWSVNCGGTQNLARAIARHTPAATVFFVSSSEVYGQSFRDGPVDETSPIRPQNAYARSKAAAEWLLDDILPKESTLIIARSFNHTGPGQDERFVLPSFAAQIARIEAGEQPPVMKVGNLDAERDFLHVQDVVGAYMALLAQAGGMQPRNLFNVSSGQAIPIRSLLETLRQLARVPLTVEIDPERMRPSDIASAVGINLRLVEQTGWRPAISVDDLLGSVLQSARARLAGPRG